MLRIARKRTTAIRLGIYGGRYLVRRKRDQLGIYAGIWRRARERKPRHHPGKKAFLNWLLNGRQDRDLCITSLAPCFHHIDVRTLRGWVGGVSARGAIKIENPGNGRTQGLRVSINRARVYQLMDELAQGERELAARRRQRPLFYWKSDPSPTPLSYDRKLREPQQIGTILKPLTQDSWKPPATRFRDPDAQDPDAPDGAAVKGRDDEKTEETGETLPAAYRSGFRPRSGYRTGLARMEKFDADGLDRPKSTSDSTPDSVSQTRVSGFRQIYEAIGDLAAGQDSDAPDGAAVKGKTWPEKPKPKIRDGPENTIVVKDPKLAQALNHFLQMGAATSRAGDAGSETASGATSATASRVRVVLAIPDTIPKSDLTDR